MMTHVSHLHTAVQTQQHGTLIQMLIQMTVRVYHLSMVVWMQKHVTMILLLILPMVHASMQRSTMIVMMFV